VIEAVAVVAPDRPVAETSEPVTVAPDVVVAPVATEAAAPKAPLFVLRPRHKRYAMLAASVAFAAVVGAVVGAVASGGFAPPPPAPRVDTAALDEAKSAQQSVARLTKEIATLKANLEAATKAQRTQIAKISERLSDRLNRDAAEVTGSISAPDTTAPAPASAPAATPTPIPRPAPRIASVETQAPIVTPAPAPARTPIVAGWSIRDTRGGFIYVESQEGIFQVSPGAPLPGLGPVESIKRQDGRWVVHTPKGIIVSMRDRRHFESF
jgi:hypothetical protein